ncbi:transposase [Kurthia sibirica]|uniref:Transposase IS204/IS1001/IS1096/IS1165 DDE domain-containing protein n=1 Tax=Kurthia sibirica TaxID=202750 RepID=A0A2U3AQ40_9BACL|nr:hypothetical protein DEX24_02080 [Kurthia sibirica]GEK32825.1 hypothetical protein KSI01_03580 [Kurthia sibirica]
MPAIHTFKNGQVEILNGLLEGIHHKIKVLKRNAFECRRLDHFQAKILLNRKDPEIGLHLE